MVPDNDFQFDIRTGDSRNYMVAFNPSALLSSSFIGRIGEERRIITAARKNGSFTIYTPLAQV
jgi:hypothetical protein